MTTMDQTIDPDTTEDHSTMSLAVKQSYRSVIKNVPLTMAGINVRRPKQGLYSYQITLVTPCYMSFLPYELFSIVVFGCISAAGYDSQYGHCIFNKNQDACHYGVAIGVLAFLACLLFLAVDAQFNSISNSEMRGHLVKADLGFSGLWTFLWFVGFCFLADQWRKSDIKSQNQTNHARAAIAFSFFSIFTWVGLTLLAYQRYRQGDGYVNTGEYQGGGGGGGYGQTPGNEYGKSPYASFPHPGEEDSLGTGGSASAYQQQPFGVPEQPFGVPPPAPVKTDYSVPGY